MTKRRPSSRSLPAKSRSALCICPCNNEGKNRRAVTEFFEDARNHQGAKARRVRSDEDKGKLPRQGDPRESIEESRMDDGRCIIAPDQIKHKVKRRDD